MLLYTGLCGWLRAALHRAACCSTQGCVGGCVLLYTGLCGWLCAALHRAVWVAVYRAVWVAVYLHVQCSVGWCISGSG